MSTSISQSKNITVRPLIYFEVLEEKVYLLLKSKDSGQWHLPSFTMLCKDSSVKELSDRVLMSIEEDFAISSSEVNSIVQFADIANKETSDLSVPVQISEEAVIVLSDKYEDYCWKQGSNIKQLLGLNASE